MRCQLLALPIEFEENFGLAAQDIGLDWLLDKIDGASLVTLETALSIRRAGRHENDGDAPGFLVAPHKLGKLEAVKARHLHVDQRQGNIILQEDLKGLIAASDAYLAWLKAKPAPAKGKAAAKSKTAGKAKAEGKIKAGGKAKASVKTKAAAKKAVKSAKARA